MDQFMNGSQLAITLNPNNIDYSQYLFTCPVPVPAVSPSDGSSQIHAAKHRFALPRRELNLSCQVANNNILTQQLQHMAP